MITSCIVVLLFLLSFLFPGEGGQGGEAPLTCTFSNGMDACTMVPVSKLTALQNEIKAISAEVDTKVGYLCTIWFVVDRLAFCSLQIKQIEDKHAQEVGKIKAESMAASAKYQEQLEAADEEQNTLYDVALGKHLAMVQEHEDELRGAEEGAAAMMQKHEDELRDAKKEAAVQLDAAVEQVKAGLDMPNPIGTLSVIPAGPPSVIW